jgi:Low molecular weight phosphotyrosine protein phosphatase
MSSSFDSTVSRRSLLLLPLGFLVAGRLGAAPKPPRILFVCQYGSVKSAITRELFKRRAREAGISVSVSSRGITPEAHLNPKVRDQLAVEGIDPDSQPLTRLRHRDLRKADIVIAFNPIPAEFGAPRSLDWSATPSVNDDYAKARPEIDRRIEGLLATIAEGQPMPKSRRP